MAWVVRGSDRLARLLSIATLLGSVGVALLATASSPERRFVWPAAHLTDLLVRRSGMRVRASHDRAEVPAYHRRVLVPDEAVACSMRNPTPLGARTRTEEPLLTALLLSLLADGDLPLSARRLDRGVGVDRLLTVPSGA